MATTAKRKPDAGKKKPAKAPKAVEYESHPLSGRVVAEQRAVSAIYFDQTAMLESPAILKRPRGGKRIAFGWYGGKFSHLDWLLPRAPA